MEVGPDTANTSRHCHWPHCFSANHHCRSANQMSPLLLAHRTTPTLPIYSVLAVAAVVPPSQFSVFGSQCNLNQDSTRATVEWQWTEVYSARVNGSLLGAVVSFSDHGLIHELLYWIPSGFECRGRPTRMERDS